MRKLSKFACSTCSHTYIFVGYIWGSSPPPPPCQNASYATGYCVIFDLEITRNFRQKQNLKQPWVPKAISLNIIAVIYGLVGACVSLSPVFTCRYISRNLNENLAHVARRLPPPSPDEIKVPYRSFSVCAADVDLMNQNIDIIFPVIHVLGTLLGTPIE